VLKPSVSGGGGWTAATWLVGAVSVVRVGVVVGLVGIDDCRWETDAGVGMAGDLGTGETATAAG